MILTTDVAYRDDMACAAGILHPDWRTDEIARTITKTISPVAPYEPGQFYQRELPCILSLLEDIDGDLEAIVVDGYVDLGGDAKPGLGRRLYEAIGGAVAVIGVAKSAFKDTPDTCRILRGKSKTPLFVTAAGLPLSQAKSHILSMHGEHRLPTLIKKADMTYRENVP